MFANLIAECRFLFEGKKRSKKRSRSREKSRSEENRKELQRFRGQAMRQSAANRDKQSYAARGLHARKVERVVAQKARVTSLAKHVNINDEPVKKPALPRVSAPKLKPLPKVQ